MHATPGFEQSHLGRLSTSFLGCLPKERAKGDTRGRHAGRDFSFCFARRFGSCRGQHAAERLGHVQVHLLQTAATMFLQ